MINSTNKKIKDNFYFHASKINNVDFDQAELKNCCCIYIYNIIICVNV